MIISFYIRISVKLTLAGNDWFSSMSWGDHFFSFEIDNFSICLYFICLIWNIVSIVNMEQFANDLLCRAEAASLHAYLSLFLSPLPLSLKFVHLSVLVLQSYFFMNRLKFLESLMREYPENETRKMSHCRVIWCVLTMQVAV